MDIAGNVYVGGWSGFIRKIWALDGGISTVAGTGILGYSGDGGPATSAMLGKTIGIAIDNAGNIYITDADNNRIRRVDVSNRNDPGNPRHWFSPIRVGYVDEMY